MAKTKKSIIKRANNRVTKLIKKDIIKKNAIITGDMIRSIDVVFKEGKGGDVDINLNAIHYYLYVDQGTKHIKPRKITEDVFKSKAFEDILEDLMFDWNDLRINDILIKLGKNKNIKTTL